MPSHTGPAPARFCAASSRWPSYPVRGTAWSRPGRPQARAAPRAVALRAIRHRPVASRQATRWRSPHGRANQRPPAPWIAQSRPRAGSPAPQLHTWAATRASPRSRRSKPIRSTPQRVIRPTSGGAIRPWPEPVAAPSAGGVLVVAHLPRLVLGPGVVGAAVREVAERRVGRCGQPLAVVVHVRRPAGARRRSRPSAAAACPRRGPGSGSAPAAAGRSARPGWAGGRPGRPPRRPGRRPPGRSPPRRPGGPPGTAAAPGAGCGPSSPGSGSAPGGRSSRCVQPRCGPVEWHSTGRPRNRCTSSSRLRTPSSSWSTTVILWLLSWGDSARPISAGLLYELWVNTHGTLRMGTSPASSYCRSSWRRVWPAGVGRPCGGRGGQGSHPGSDHHPRDPDTPHAGQRSPTGRAEAAVAERRRRCRA